MKKISVTVLMTLMVFSLALPALASGLTLDITSAAMEELEKEGYEWHVKPGTYQGF